MTRKELRTAFVMWRAAIENAIEKVAFAYGDSPPPFPSFHEIKKDAMAYNGSRVGIEEMAAAAVMFNFKAIAKMMKAATKEPKERKGK